MPGAPGLGPGAAAMTKKEAAAVATAPKRAERESLMVSSLSSLYRYVGQGRLFTLPFGHVHDFANSSPDTEAAAA